MFVELSNTKIELLHPYGEKSPIQNFLTKNPSGGVHHVCIEVCDERERRVVGENTMQRIGYESEERREW